MQGRLSQTSDNIIQSFPKMTWKKEFELATKEIPIIAKEVESVKETTIPKDLLELKCTIGKETTVSRELHFKSMKVSRFQDGEICTIKKVSLKYE